MQVSSRNSESLCFSVNTTGEIGGYSRAILAHSSYATLDHLKELWEKRKNLEWEGTSLLAVVASECANGSVNEHPWLSVLETKNFMELLRLGLANTPSFCIRAEEAGVDQGPYLDAMGYLILRVLMVSAASELMSVLDTFMDLPDVRELILVPIFDRLLVGVRDACSRDCDVVSFDLRGENEETAEHYWERLRVPPKHAPKVPAWKRYLLIMQDTNKLCKVGFPINEEHTCPLVDGRREVKLSDLKGLTEVLKKVVVKRA